MRQIGVAVGNSVTATCEELAVIRARDGKPDWQQLDRLLEEWHPNMLVVGEPLNMDDSESELSQLARKFGRRLAERYQLPVEFMDERLSSFEAKQMLREQGHGGDYRENPADSLAARLILESWLRAAG